MGRTRARDHGGQDNMPKASGSGGGAGRNQEKKAYTVDGVMHFTKMAKYREKMKKKFKNKEKYMRRKQRAEDKIEREAKKAKPKSTVSKKPETRKARSRAEAILRVVKKKVSMVYNSKGK